MAMTALASHFVRRAGKLPFTQRHTAFAIRREFKMNRSQRTPILVLAGMFVAAGLPNVQARDCSNATLRGGYGCYNGAIVAPGMPRANVGRIDFDGKGAWTLNLVQNDNGTIKN